jgi:hypothetical protein
LWDGADERVDNFCYSAVVLFAMTIISEQIPEPTVIILVASNVELQFSVVWLASDVLTVDTTVPKQTANMVKKN